VKPSEEEALRLHLKFGSNDAIVRHCKTVAMVTSIIVEEFRRQGKDVDLRAAVAGAMLHDIGRNRVQTAWHGLEGSKILEGEGVDETVVQIVRRHVGAGLSPEEARKLGLPDLDYIPRTREQVAVCFADKMVDADKVRPFEEEVKRFARKGHDVERLQALRRNLEADLGKDPEVLVFDKIKGTRWETTASWPRASAAPADTRTSKAARSAAAVRTTGAPACRNLLLGDTTAEKHNKPRFGRTIVARWGSQSQGRG
jgi:uncharacterized protein (TIGR00295 family)